MKFLEQDNRGRESTKPLAFIHVLGMEWEKYLDGVLSGIPKLDYSDIPREERDFYRATLTSFILTDVVTGLDRDDQSGLVHFFTELAKKVEDERLEIHDTLCDEEGNLPSIIRKRADSIRRFIGEKNTEESLPPDVIELPDIQEPPDIREEADTIGESISGEEEKTGEGGVLLEGEKEIDTTKKSKQEPETRKEERLEELPELPPLLERWYRDARPQDRLNLLAIVRHSPGLREDDYVLVSVNGTGGLIRAEEVLDFLEKLVSSTKP